MKRFSLIILVFALIFSPIALFAQEQATIRARANVMFQRYEYAMAIPLYLSLVNTPNPKYNDLLKLAESYYFNRDFENASIWYDKVLNHKECTPLQILSYGDAMRAVGEYHLAQQSYKQYQLREPNGVNVQDRLESCDSSMNWLNNPTQYNVVNVKDLNTKNSEFALYPIGGNSWHFVQEIEHGKRSYSWTGRPFLKVVNTEKQGDVWTNVSMLTLPFNHSNYHVGPVATPNHGGTWYVTRTIPNISSSNERSGKLRLKTHRLELVIFKEVNGKWIEEKFPYQNPNEYSMGHAAFSPDGQIIYFVSDRPGGYGGTDIWYCVKEGDSWSLPKNAGPEINSIGNELFPHVDGSNGNLYFASDGHIGMGGLDVFESKGKASQWSKPFNLGFPVNSPADDFAFIISSDTEFIRSGYLSSNRAGGIGEDDIYSFSFKKPQPKPEPIKLILLGKVINLETRLPLAKASVNLQVVGQHGQQSYTTTNDGKFLFQLSENQDYIVEGNLSQYLSDQKSLSTIGRTKSDTLEVVLELAPQLKVGRTFVLENLYYDYDKANIRPDAAIVLDELIATMNEFPSLKIELSSHTDSRGNDAYNLKLSERRAQAAVEYMISKGIHPNRLVAIGYGETQLLNECGNGVKCSEELHQKNRRTEFKVIAIDP